MAESVSRGDGFSPKNLPPAITAGLVTGLFSIPEGMAYAQLAGMNPLYGLYAGVAATLVAAIFTGSVLMISTLTSAIALSTGSVLITAGIGKEDLPGALFTVTLLTGAVMLVLGLLRLGSMVNFVSNSVMTGFIAGASLLILIGELGDFSGYDPDGGNKVAEVWDWVVHIGQWDLATTMVSVITVVLVVLGKSIRLIAKLAPVIVLAVMTVAVALLEPASVATVADIASIPSSLPAPSLPDLSVAPELLLGATSVAIVALAQGAGISTAYPNPSGSDSPPSRDFIGQGLGNIAGSFLSSMPTGGSLSRTGISVSAGASSRWGGVLAAAWLAVLVALFGSMAQKVPLAVIAGLLVVIAVELIEGRVKNAMLSYRASTMSWVGMVLTFAATLFIPLQWSILLGVLFSVLVYLGESFRSGTVSELRREGDYWTEHDAPAALSDGTVTVIGLRNWNFFAEFAQLDRKLPDPGGARGAVLVLRMRDLRDVNSTALRALDGYDQRVTRAGNTLVLAGVQPKVAATLSRTGLTERIGVEHIFPAGAGITQALDDAYAHAQQLTTDR